MSNVVRRIIQGTLCAAALISQGAFAMDFPVGNFAGNYIVPGPVDDVEQSSFPTTYSVTKEDSTGNLILKYSLSGEIVGSDSVNINLIQNQDNGDGVLILGNDKGDQSTCKVTTVSLVCFSMYPNLTLSLPDILTTIKKLHPLEDDILFNLRKKAAEAFEGDPKGLVFCPFTSKKS
jgi:hypothetical protein